MNRLVVKYLSATQGRQSNLEIYNDLKGYTFTQIGETFYGYEADLMLELFKNTEIIKNDNIMLYEVYVDNELLEKSDK